ncbi:MAG TPA: hypothetical protein VHM19_18215 [Polyangiales bacterium]|nr:hypothetical protein [Polyangiales bacterium]
MSRRDVVKSLLRSAAVGAGEQLAALGVTSSLKRTLSSLASGRMFIPDARLTAAVARVPEVVAATVTTRDGSMRIDLSFRDSPPLVMGFAPLSVTFATHGAKEWSVRVEPPAAALDPRCGDVLTALAGEVARSLWGPFLRREPPRGRLAFAHREHDVLIVDLRTLPEVRAALSQRLYATGIDALALQDIVAADGGIRLHPRLPGL